MMESLITLSHFVAPINESCFNLPFVSHPTLTFNISFNSSLSACPCYLSFTQSIPGHSSHYFLLQWFFPTWPLTIFQLNLMESAPRLANDSLATLTPIPPSDAYWLLGCCLCFRASLPTLYLLWTLKQMKSSHLHTDSQTNISSNTWMTLRWQSQVYIWGCSISKSIKQRDCTKYTTELK